MHEFPHAPRSAHRRPAPRSPRPTRPRPTLRLAGRARGARGALPALLALCGALPAACCTPSQFDPRGVADPSLPLPGAQPTPDPATPAALVRRRAKVAEALGEGPLVLFAGEDGDRRFHADPDFRYLAGAIAPGAVLALVIEKGAVRDSRIYLRETSPTQALWEGATLAPGERARERAAVQRTAPLSTLAEDLRALAATAPAVYADVDRLPATVRAALGLDREGGAEARSPRAALSAAQAVKDSAEIEAIRTAVRITEAALADGFLAARAGAYEYEVEAAIEAGFRRRGAEHLAFPSICGSGPNGCILHYRDNGRRIEAGELLLLDVGAEYAGYAADLTRTLPVDGAFSPRQRELYELVVAASDAAAAALRPGATLGDAQRAARAIFAAHGLAGAFPHGVGHHLGMRVHDAPGFSGPLAPGMVVTIEPGLYLPEEAIGIRIENDWRIGEDGAELLSDRLPWRTAELEAYLARLRGGS